MLESVRPDINMKTTSRFQGAAARDGMDLLLGNSTTTRRWVTPRFTEGLRPSPFLLPPSCFLQDWLPLASSMVISDPKIRLRGDIVRSRGASVAGCMFLVIVSLCVSSGNSPSLLSFSVFVFPSPFLWIVSRFYLVSFRDDVL